MVRCSLCHREGVEGGYCVYHRAAYANLVEAYKVWEKSVKLTWKVFLKEVIQAKETGEWARGVAQDQLTIGSAKN